VDAFLAGRLHGVGVEQEAGLGLAGRPFLVTGLVEPLLLTAAIHPDGWVVGTGNEGKVLLVRRDGTVETLLDAPEAEVFALRVERDGTVYAGTSPNGKVYRISGGRVSEHFDPGEVYIWDLARDADGGLLVATGTGGRLYRVLGEGDGSVVYDGHEPHLRAILVTPDGRTLLGTSGAGLVLELEGRDRAKTLYDPPGDEVVALVAAPDGRVYGACVAGDGSKGGAGPGPPAVAAAVASDSAPLAAADSGTESTGGGLDSLHPPASAGPSASQVFSILPDGRVEVLETLDGGTVHSLLWHRERLWAGTGPDGRLYRADGIRLAMENGFEERQLVRLLPDGAGLAVATTNAAALYRLGVDTEREGTYTSVPLDVGATSRFGTFRWWGDQPAQTGVAFSFRSGVSPEPDATWSPWTAASSGRSIDLRSLPAGHYVQWRAELRSIAEATPRIRLAQISYVQENSRPRIVELAVSEPGRILVPAAFNPADQVFEPVHPNRDGIFTTLDTSASRATETGVLKTLWKRGFRSLRWRAEDGNDDRLSYSLWFRRDGEGHRWLPIADELEDDYYNFDSTVLPDGLYRFRLLATDRRDHRLGGALEAESVSSPVVVDHAPPTLRSVARAGTELRLRVGDEWSPLRRVEISVDGGAWAPVAAADGILDDLEETVVLTVPPEAELLLLRAMDAAFNGAAFDLQEAIDGRRRASRMRRSDARGSGR
jgi:hypothetical protein